MDGTNSTPHDVSDPTPSEPQSSKKGINKWVALVIFVVVLGVLAGGAYWLQTRTTPPSHQNPTPTPNPTPVNSAEPLVSGLIEWQHPSPGSLNIFNSGIDPTGSMFYTVGVFNSGQYQGQNLVVASVPCEGPCPATVLRLAVKGAASDQPVITVLKNYSDSLDNLNLTLVDKTKYAVDTTTKISDLDVPGTLAGTNAKQKLVLTTPGPFQSSYNIFNVTNLKLVYTDPKVGAVYTTPDNPKNVDSFFATYGFYVKLPDWNTAIYKYLPDFVGSDNIPNLTWNDNTQNKNEYQDTHLGGCGTTDYAALVDPGIIKYTDLKAAGKTANGDAVYEFVDSNAQMLKDMYKNDYQPELGGGFQYPNAKIPYDQFVTQHPMFFWTDPFGRLIQFKNKKFIVIMAECGKPVIYLYPTQTENVSVKLNPTGGFSYTEPVYGSGWNVSAQPNGTLTNLVDNKTYPYLFWEGRSNGIYQTPEKGFVVAQSMVHKLLNEKLGLLGLNAQETADFEAYWEPYMQSAPYYFVTFMGNSVMDQIAPLSISPKPDTVIRILMDFKPLQQPIQVQGYDIKTPVRSGFTVVEWGGVKH